MISLEPKVRFLKDEAAVKWWLELTRSKQFQDAVQVALAQFAMDQPKSQGLEEGCRSNYQLEGARRFIDTLLNLAESAPTPTTGRASDNLLWQPPSKTPRPVK